MRTLLFAAIIVHGATAFAAVDYDKDVKPLLHEKCGACHGVLKQEAGLRLDAGTLIVKGGEDGPVVVAGAAVKSRLIERVNAADDERMPPPDAGPALTAEQKRILTEWIDAGAASPANEEILAGPQDHWAFQPIRRPAVPAFEGAADVNPIDAFLAKSQQAKNLKPAPKADKATLLRRVTLDMIGLPPTDDELRTFLADESPDAWRQRVEALMASPRFGERWGRRWMDVWRYSDWDGFGAELRGSQKHIWHWRDWIIESLNADKAYDRMIVEMLAADEAAPTDASALRATGFLARSHFKNNRDVWLDAIVEHTSKAFLGLTVNCARCHDHKFDPITQREFYSFRAIFEPHQVRTDRLPGQPNVAADGVPRVYDATLDAQTFLYIGGNEKQPDKEHPVSPAPPAFFEVPFEIRSVDKPLLAYAPDLASHVEVEDVAAAELNLKNAVAAETKLREAPQKTKGVADSEVALLESDLRCLDGGGAVATELELAELNVREASARLDALKARWSADRAKFQNNNGVTYTDLALRAATCERAMNLFAAKRAYRAKEAALVTARESKEKDNAKRKMGVTKAEKDFDQARVALRKATIDASAVNATYTPVVTEHPRTSTGRRLALARWITSKENPLTARVAVNHLWAWHFGEPLSDETSDFGLRAPKPVQAELLDWLASEFIVSGWSMKHMHRLMVSSEAYQRASNADDAMVGQNGAIDPQNKYLWRANARRLEAEAIRDSLLYLANSLDTTTSGPELPSSQGESVYRRSLYFQSANEKQMAMLVMFDAASPGECYRRSTSIVPQQALALSNSGLSLSMARLIARLPSSPRSDDAAFVRWAFERVLSRAPRADEVSACVEFLASQRNALKDTTTLSTFETSAKALVAAAESPADRSRENLIHVLLNHNDFVTVR